MSDNDAMNDVLASFRLAGFFTSHALDSLTSPNLAGEHLQPILVAEDSTGRISLNRLALSDMSFLDNVLNNAFDENPHWVAANVLLEGGLTLDDGSQTNAVIITSYLLPSRMILGVTAVPFIRNTEGTLGNFGGTRFVNLDEQLQAPELTQMVSNSFVNGSQAHPHAYVWSQYLTESY